MITRGIVEGRIDPYRVRVRVPLVDGVASAANSTRSENLNAAVLATVPGLEVDLQYGDVVIVDIEGESDSSTILGYLYRDASVQKRCSMFLNILDVAEYAVLPDKTRIGNVTDLELSFLSGLKDNIQIQLDTLSSRIADLEGG